MIVLYIYRKDDLFLLDFFEYKSSKKREARNYLASFKQEIKIKLRKQNNDI